MWLQDLSNSLKLSILERSTSPALGSFISFWLVFNWKPIIYLFYSDTSIKATLAHLNSDYTDPWINLGYPLICSSAFLVLYPFVSAGAFGLWGLGDRCKNKLTRKLHSDRVLSNEEGDALIEENESIKGKYRLIISDMEKDKALVEERAQALHDQNIAQSRKFSELEDSLATSEASNDNYAKAKQEWQKLEIELSASNAEMTKQRHSLMAENEHLRKNLTTSTNRLNELENRADDLDKKLSQKKLEITKLQIKQEQYQKAVAQLSDKDRLLFSSLTADINEMKTWGRLKSKRKEMDKQRDQSTLINSGNTDKQKLDS